LKKKKEGKKKEKSSQSYSIAKRKYKTN